MTEVVLRYRYQVVAQLIQTEIQSEQLAAGSRLASYRELCERYNVSEITIRHAIVLLQQNGWLYGKRGRGNGFFINRPELSRRSEHGKLRRIALYIRWPLTGAHDSDLPELQRSISAASYAAGFGVELFPRQEETAMLSMLRLWQRSERPDGIMLLPRSYESTLEVIRCFRKYQQRFAILCSAQTGTAEELRCHRYPGIYVNETSALHHLLAIVKRKQIRRLQLVGTRLETVERLRTLLDRLGAGADFLIEEYVPGKNFQGSLTALLQQQTVLCATNRKRLLLVEGSSCMLAVLDAVLEMQKLRPGDNLSVAFFQHYCDLPSEYLTRYTSLTRSLEKIGVVAANFLINGIRGTDSDRQIVIPAAFNDNGTI